MAELLFILRELYVSKKSINLCCPERDELEI